MTSADAPPRMDEPRRDPSEHLKGYRWKKGTSGNPGGRARKGTNIRAVLKQVLAQDHNGKSYYQLLGELLYREAMKGKHAFLKEILDRVEGPANRRDEQAETVMKRVVYTLNVAVPPVMNRPLPQRDDPGRDNVRVLDNENRPGS